MSLYKRGKTYYMDIQVNGQRVNKSTKMQNRRDAEKIMETERKKVLQFTGQSSIPTLTEALDRIYEDKWATQKDGEGSFNRVLWVAQNFDNPHLDEINQLWLSNLRKWLVSGGRKGARKIATINRHLAHIRTILLMARDEWEILDKIPKVKLRTEKNGRTRVISKEEQETLTKLLRNSCVTRRPYDKDVADLVDVLCDTGMRLGEALGLKEHNIDNGMIKLFPGDTKDSEARTIPLTDKAKEILEKNLFKKLDKDKAGRAFRWAKKQMGIEDPEFVLHACRHTFASRMLEAGASLYEVKELLGHSSYSTTQRYSHMATEHLKKAINKLN